MAPASNVSEKTNATVTKLPKNNFC